METVSQDCGRPPHDGLSEYVGTTADGRFGIRLPTDVVAQISDCCGRARDFETGGILVGTYSEDRRTAQVTEALPAPSDSKAGPTWFLRGVKGLSAKLRRRWRSGGGYYLGEWHYHPAGTPTPSRRDTMQMRFISKSGKYQCPEPVLVIVGGTSPQLELRSYVFPRDEERLEFATG